MINKNITANSCVSAPRSIQNAESISTPSVPKTSVRAKFLWLNIRQHLINCATYYSVPVYKAHERYLFNLDTFEILDQTITGHIGQFSEAWLARWLLNNLVDRHRIELFIHSGESQITQLNAGTRCQLIQTQNHKSVSFIRISLWKRIIFKCTKQFNSPKLVRLNFWDKCQSGAVEYGSSTDQVQGRDAIPKPGSVNDFKIEVSDDARDAEYPTNCTRALAASSRPTVKILPPKSQTQWSEAIIYK